jgi:hypothetical protein
MLIAAALAFGLAATPAMAGGDDSKNKKEIDLSSPYIVGAWKFQTNQSGSPTVDSEFRFINPTKLSLTLEYAFFELDGTFCGCDRDDFPPNKTTVYTMFQESQLGPAIPNGPPVFSCTGPGGALKSIVFLSDGNDIVLDDASQVGFQTHAFGVLLDTDPPTSAGGNLQGQVMTEAGMQAVSINEATRKEIRKIHEQCVTVNGPLTSTVWQHHSAQSH